MVKKMGNIMGYAVSGALAGFLVGKVYLKGKKDGAQQCSDMIDAFLKGVDTGEKINNTDKEKSE